MRGLGCAVTLVEIGDVPLSRVLGEDMGRFYGQVHRDHGVDLRTGVGVREILGDTVVRRVVLTDGATVPADVVVVGIGIVPSTGLAEGIGAEVAGPAPGGILVDEFCDTTVPGVFAAGDVANHHNAILGGRVRLEHWRNAQNQAVAAAASILGEREPFCEVPWFWSDQYDLKLQVAGHPSAVDDVVSGRSTLITVVGLGDHECGDVGSVDFRQAGDCGVLGGSGGAGEGFVGQGRRRRARRRGARREPRPPA